MRIDFHTHCFPDALAARTIPMLSKTAETQPVTDGTLGGLLAHMDAQGVDLSILHHVATKPTQTETINAYAASIQSSCVMCFGALHPDMPDVHAGIARIKELGLCGVKLHPAYQRFHVDEPRLACVYDAIAASGLPVLFHAGFDPVMPGENYAPPCAFAQLAKSYPSMPIIAAHLGGMDCWEDVLRDLAGQPVYMDTSMITLCREPMLIREILLAHDKNRILFATDCPWGDAVGVDAYLAGLGLQKEFMDRIYWKNAARLLLECGFMVPGVDREALQMRHP